MKVDLVVERNGRAFGIDLIGYPGRWVEAIELERYRMFRRAGLSLFALAFREWSRDRDDAVSRILRFAEEHETTRFRGRI